MKPIPPFSDEVISKAMHLILAYHEQKETENSYIDASFLSFHGVCAKGYEMPLIEHLCSRGFISYTDGGSNGRKRIVILPAGYTFPEEEARRHKKEIIDDRRFRIPVAISIIALVVSIISLIRTW